MDWAGEDRETPGINQLVLRCGQVSLGKAPVRAQTSIFLIFIPELEAGATIKPSDKSRSTIEKIRDQQSLYLSDLGSASHQNFQARPPAHIFRRYLQPKHPSNRLKCLFSRGFSVHESDRAQAGFLRACLWLSSWLQRKGSAHQRLAFGLKRNWGFSIYPRCLICHIVESPPQKRPQDLPELTQFRNVPPVVNCLYQHF